MQCRRLPAWARPGARRAGGGRGLPVLHSSCKFQVSSLRPATRGLAKPRPCPAWARPNLAGQPPRRPITADPPESASALARDLRLTVTAKTQSSRVWATHQWLPPQPPLAAGAVGRRPAVVAGNHRFPTRWILNQVSRLQAARHSGWPVKQNELEGRGCRGDGGCVTVPRVTVTQCHGPANSTSPIIYFRKSSESPSLSPAAACRAAIPTSG